MADEKSPTFFRTEKRSQDPAVANAEAGKQPPVVYETPDYEVLIGTLSGPETTPMELRFRYVIRHKRHRIIYGTAGGIGQAIAAAIQAQVELLNAGEAAKEFEARNFKMTEEAPPKGPLIPDFSGGMN